MKVTFERIDTWIGKTLFVPLIIRICQITGCPQHRFHHVCWFIAALVGFYCANSLWGKIFFGIFATICCLVAALAIFPGSSSRWFRLMVAVFAIMQLPAPDWHLGYSLLILAAEYAATIRTIPPLESKKRGSSAASATEAA